ncbi:MAG: XdhC family protein [Gammaproteobacteria bacterium]|nr:XdhC family protein [Gammaproteobacteria bacterium]
MINTSGPVDVLEAALTWRESGHGVALATVVSTWGSSPSPVGSQLAVRQDGHFEGSVSGGCVEGKVIETAMESIEQGTTKLLGFSVTDEEAWEVGLACGGSVEVYVEPVE